MWAPERAALIRRRRLFEARCLLEEIRQRYCLTKRCYVLNICLYVYVLFCLCLIYVIYFFIIIFFFITIKHVISLTLKNLFGGHVCQKLNLRVLLRFCLIFCQFQPGVAYKSVAYKKACIMVRENSYNNVPLINFKVNYSKLIVGLSGTENVVKNSSNILNFFLLGNNTNILLAVINMKKMKKQI